MLEDIGEHIIILQTLTKGELVMYTYELWVRINSYQTINTRVQASNDFDAKMIGEAMYGQGNVLGYHKIDD